MTTIPSYYLTISEKDYRLLNKHAKTDFMVPATLNVLDECFSVNVGYRGAHTRKFAKKSFRIEFISEHSISLVREVHFNAEFVDPSFMRNKLSFDFFTEIGSLAPMAQHILLYINESCAGIYLKLESVDECFLHKRHLANGPIYYAVNSNANFSLYHPKSQKVKDSLEAGYERKCGTADDDVFLRELIFKTITTPQDEFEVEIDKILEIDNYLHWLAGAVCTQNYDAFIHNYALYRNEETKKFSIIPWDYDATWGRNVNGKVMDHTFLPIDGFNTLTARILDVAHFRKRYSLILEDILETSFTPDHLEPRIAELHQLLRPCLPLDPFKKDKLESFDAEPDFILSFIQNRSDYLRQCLVSFQSNV